MCDYVTPSSGILYRQNYGLSGLTTGLIKILSAYYLLLNIMGYARKNVIGSRTSLIIASVRSSIH
jgi:hypothetical protein